MKDPHLPLVHRCQAGDRQAEFELYRRYRKAMQHIAWKIVRDDVEAEDIVQEAFIKAFRALHRFQEACTFGAWLKRITINTALNHVKQRQLELVPLEEHPVTEAEDKPQREEYPWSYQEIHRAVNQLPDGYRKVLRLYLFEGFDHAEIGDILSISEATSKSQFCRAKRKLRQLLTHQSPRYAAA